MEKLFDSEKSRKAQKEYTDSINAPHFAPYSGKCYNCNRDIYTEIKHRDWATGIDVKTASTTLVTGCPHCNRSYCD